MSERLYNFSAGPATLPLDVIERVKADLPLFQDTGASVLEISHRSAAFANVLEEAEAAIRDLLSIPDGYKVLFLQGGASTQFAMIPLNFLAGTGQTADYLKVGTWADKAIKEAKRAGAVHVAFDGSSEGYKRMPRQEELRLTPGAAYVHTTSNETIQGIQFATEPDTGSVPLICDSSSDFMCRPTDVSKYGMIYAGAQKNMGPAGVTLVIISDEMIERVPADQYSMLSYAVQAAKGSTFNTPPAFAIYVVGLVAKWLRDSVGGLEAIHARNLHKSKLLYDAIDGSGGFYRGHAAADSRSLMNVTWTMENADLEGALIRGAAEQGLMSLKGHRSVGGLRASIYNAMPTEGVEALVSYMAEFQRTHG
jgi:phosphoserine aminotransferase